jgi:hypothetical protein
MLHVFISTQTHIQVMGRKGPHVESVRGDYAVCVPKLQGTAVVDGGVCKGVAYMLQ